MNWSYWEYKSYLSDLDFTIVGSGIVGLSCALELRRRYPSASILVLEKGVLPMGASTKNAGFACYGSISEILSDLRSHSEETVYDLVLKRWRGIQLLRKNLGDEALDFQMLGGHEIFLEDEQDSFDECLESLPRINELLKPIFKEPPLKTKRNTFGFQGIQNTLVTHQFEGQIDTGRMMQNLIRLVYSNNIPILNKVTVQKFEESGSVVKVQTDQFEFETKKLCFATNGFASELLNENVKPARAQVLLTKPIPGLQVRGTFHLDAGYYYFRNLDGRILLGGGRNLDFAKEETTDFGLTLTIQNKLEQLLKSVILPGKSIGIERRWSGIMGVGDHKTPIVKAVSDKVFCAVRLGGMGVAIGSETGKDLAEISA
ncbi:NAD(P)/FAD-dependent oxidoreductase [Poritiphilus flavus]|uniref:FAD-dependent oxidoreductase n=1 Tax=Poritiphilus flavus TaxID=2697053 RepID=A0A6L9ECS5_9FLAO|nr:FAD-dependent oxidoreductase [Poritiphilus flavus]NAS12432.1 FAD-dependent oxidoreductase [Poritiphilus flavus]